MAASSKLLDPSEFESRKSLPNLWHTDLRGAICADAPWCILSICCGPCVSYILRSRTLYDDMSRYQCCGGMMPCSGKCGESKSPKLCLGMEVVCCFSMSVASTRFLIQDQLQIQTSKCDNCIFAFMICLQQLACIFWILACITGNDVIQEISNVLNCLSNLVYCSVCSCMQTQHKVELDKRDGKLEGVTPHSAIQMAPPQTQTMSQDYPPQHYPPQAYPPQAYPPQPYPPQAYPAQPYPPQAYPPQPYPPQPYPPQAYPPQVYPPQAYPPQGY